jgi:branched-chain amino acid aminotransferase
MSVWSFSGGSWRRGVGSVPLDDRLWRLGDGCFETLRVENGLALFCGLHLERFRRGLKALGIDASLAQAQKACAKLPVKKGVFALRLYVSGGRGGTLGAVTGPQFYASLTPYARPKMERLTVATYQRQDLALAALKIPRYAEAIVALRQRRADDVLACDGHGRVLESSTGNVFALINGRLVTPPVDGRILRGVTRDQVLRLGKGREAAITLQALKKAEAVFLTSSLRGIARVARIDQKNVPWTARGESLTRMLIEAYAQLR